MNLGSLHVLTIYFKISHAFSHGILSKDISLAKPQKKAERNHIIHIFISMLTCSGFLVSLYLSTLTYKLEMITAPAT